MTDILIIIAICVGVICLIATIAVGLKVKNSSAGAAEKKLEEMRLVGRAKCMLMQYRGLTEQQAHRQIEKQAMDSRQTRGAVALEILDTYEP